jgi:NADH-quinone oxidoreductase subunit L
MHEECPPQRDPGRFRRFFVYFNLFIMAMMILVSSNNFLKLFVVGRRGFVFLSPDWFLV